MMDCAPRHGIAPVSSRPVKASISLAALDPAGDVAGAVSKLNGCTIAPLSEAVAKRLDSFITHKNIPLLDFAPDHALRTDIPLVQGKYRSAKKNDDGSCSFGKVRVSDADGAEAYEHARTYLSRVPFYRSLVYQLESGSGLSEKYYIGTEIRINNDRYNSCDIAGPVHWDPHGSIPTIDGGISPALSLAHELTHRYHREQSSIDMGKRVLSFARGYKHAEEYATMHHEREAAKILGEGQRHNYFTDFENRPVSMVTDRAALSPQEACNEYLVHQIAVGPKNHPLISWPVEDLADDSRLSQEQQRFIQGKNLTLQREKLVLENMPSQKFLLACIAGKIELADLIPGLANIHHD